MIKKFNYTGRKKLSRDRINISVVEDKPHKYFTVSLNLKGLRLPDEAKVYIEPYHKSSVMRFPFGTVANEVKPSNTLLTDIPSTSIVHFRIYVVDESEKLGRILRVAKEIKPKNLEGDTGNRKTILPIDWDKDLEQQIFRITFPNNDYPTLEINSRIENRKELVKTNPIFRSLVFPVALKEIVTKIAADSDEFDEGDDSWQSTWMKFIREVLHVYIEVDFESEEDVNYWIEEVVAAFCRKNRFRNKFEQALKK
ncbi:MAG: hypothetical protein WC599_08755 [Bacteroidales bacterium]